MAARTGGRVRPGPSRRALQTGGFLVIDGADPFALKKWIATHEAGPAVAACVPEAAPPTELLSCLRAHGLNPPSSLFELKPWMLRQSRTDAGKAAMKPCGVDFDRRPTVQELPKKGDCGGGKVAPAPGGKPKAPPTL